MRPAPRGTKPPQNSHLPLWLWIVVAALAAYSLYTGWQAQRLRRELAFIQEQSDDAAQARAKLATEFADAARTAAILTDPASLQVLLAPQQKGAPALRAYWHAGLGLVVTGAPVPLPSDGHTLEVWLLPKAPQEKPIPAGFLRPESNGRFVLLAASPPASLASTKALAVTEEPAGGSPQPTSTPRWSGPIG